MRYFTIPSENGHPIQQRDKESKLCCRNYTTLSLQGMCKNITVLEITLYLLIFQVILNLTFLLQNFTVNTCSKFTKVKYFLVRFTAFNSTHCCDKKPFSSKAFTKTNKKHYICVSTCVWFNRFPHNSLQVSILNLSLRLNSVILWKTT